MEIQDSGIAGQSETAVVGGGTEVKIEENEIIGMSIGFCLLQSSALSLWSSARRHSLLIYTSPVYACGFSTSLVYGIFLAVFCESGIPEANST